MRTLSGTTQIVGLIGWPVSHSVSPPMHNAAFAHLGLDWCYVPLPVAPEPAGRIGDAVAGLRGLGLRGANVTVPHKQAVIPHLDQLTPAAQAIGAVNTIVVTRDGTLLGDNTDAHGFIADLRSHQVEPAGRVVLMLGAGGSARAVAYGLAEAGAAAITIANRTLDKATRLAADLQSLFPACAWAACELPGGLAGHAGAATLIVNCTSLGMTPHVAGLPWDAGIPFRPDQTIYDLVYNPPVTRLLEKAGHDRARAIGGLGMLVWQGAVAFAVWTGQAAPVEVMAGAVQQIFASRSQ